MKNLFLLFLGISSHVVYGQTNIFPANGSVGIGTTNPSSYFHGGSNNSLEIFNSNTSLNSQSQLLLSTGAVLDNSNAGTISWISKNSAGSRGMAYIASSLQGNGTNNAMGRLIFATSEGGIAPVPRMWINKDGAVGIGTDEAAGHQLAVKGKIRAQKIKVETTNWPDYVFKPEYNLISLAQTELFIQ